MVENSVGGLHRRWPPAQTRIAAEKMGLPTLLSVTMPAIKKSVA
jgi:hypothetical protein